MMALVLVETNASRCEAHWNWPDHTPGSGESLIRVGGLCGLPHGSFTSSDGELASPLKANPAGSGP
jgi:hypothetical protein